MGSPTMEGEMTMKCYIVFDQVLQERLEALGVALATASVEQTRQEEQVQAMTTELEQTWHFIEVRGPTHPPTHNSYDYDAVSFNPPPPSSSPGPHSHLRSMEARGGTSLQLFP